jgi:site-specific DNA recombinase
VGVFVDRENYRATQSPNKGKIVNPSGERADRPQFLAMLEEIKTGEVDTVLCWRDDRLVRHPRVAVALEDALDIGDSKRNGKDKIKVKDATGAMIDRFTLSIKATIWREENKRRTERVRMGKVATLQQGYWPGTYQRYGYKTRKGPRGHIIEMAEDEAQVVQKIHGIYDAGTGVADIRRYLVSNGLEQKGSQKRKYEWGDVVIYNILRAKDYTGIATWNFGDGTSISIEIPAIVDRELWERNQARLDRNKRLSPRNAKGIYLLQGLVRCGDCGRAMTTSRHRWRYEDGERTLRKRPYHQYQCPTGHLPDKDHPRPYSRMGASLDWQVWRYLVDNGIKRPDLIREQVQARQAELQAQGESADGEIAHARRKLAKIDQERAFYQRQAARGKMTEAEFDARMGETEEACQYWQSELARLQELRDDAAKVEASLDYATELLTTLQEVLPEIDVPPDELKELLEEERNEILESRRDIIRALVDKVEVYASGKVKIYGLLNGSERAQFELGSPRPP